MLAAGRLGADVVAWPAAVVTAGAVLVLVAGVVAAARAPRQAGPVFAGHVPLALELLLAAGLLRLAAIDSPRALATVAGIIAVRKVVSAGIRAAAGAQRASEYPTRSERSAPVRS